LNELSFLNQSIVLGNNHSSDDEFFDVWDDECPSAPAGLSISQEYFDLKYLDLGSDSVKEYVLMKTSSSSHHPIGIMAKVLSLMATYIGNGSQYNQSVAKINE